jgi:hypothetical protein
MKVFLPKRAENQTLWLNILIPGAKKIACLLILFFSFAFTAFAQRQISGKVTADNGEALPGVTVLLKGTTTGSTTDVGGNYSLTVPSDNGTLVVSFIGYQTKEVPINNQSTINITLATDTKALDEVVVIGYGTQRKSDLTGQLPP